MFVIKEENKWPIKIWSTPESVESQAIQQLKNVSSLPFIFKHISAMPDVHLGFGATVGSVIPTKGAVIPSAVGVDIGCGMLAWNTGLEREQLPDSTLLRGMIEKVIPVGFNKRNKEHEYFEYLLEKEFTTMEMIHNIPDWVAFNKKSNKYFEPVGQKIALQFGTLGGGNHFIELSEDETGLIWVVLHSGSRGIGKLTADFYMDLAKEECNKWFVNLPDKDLAFLASDSTGYKKYIIDLDWCQKYAWWNRLAMVSDVQDVLKFLIPELKTRDFTDGSMDSNFIHCHHNYATMENHFGENILVTRKGAISAREGQLGIIPGSMGARSYIVVGLGNKDSFCSASHGAGRLMGRNEAKKRFNLKDFASQTNGVDCKKDDSVLDEIPGAYKNIDEVMANQKDLVTPIHTLKQFICIKG